MAIGVRKLQDWEFGIVRNEVEVGYRFVCAPPRRLLGPYKASSLSRLAQDPHYDISPKPSLVIEGSWCRRGFAEAAEHNQISAAIINRGKEFGNSDRKEEEKKVSPSFCKQVGRGVWGWNSSLV